MEDLKALYRYVAYEQQDVTNAERLIIAIRDAINLLDRMPKRHPLVNRPILNGKDAHRAIIKNHIILYQIDELNATVSILRILSSRQNIENII